MKQPQLLPPLPKIHLRLFQKHPLNRSLARAAIPAESFQVSLIARIRQKRFHHAHRSRVRRMRQLQRDRIHGLQLIDDDFDNPSLRRTSPAQSLELARMKNQFPQERRNIYHKTFCKASAENTAFSSKLRPT